MKKKIAILGSTGSIGKNLLSIIKMKPQNYEVTLLSANKNYRELLSQAKLFKVKNLIISNQKIYDKVKSNKLFKKTKLFKDFSSYKKIFYKNKIDYAMSSITGISGLEPTLKIIKHTKNIAIANKESIICGWPLISKELKKCKTNFVPVDSEHFTIWYALKNNKDEIEKIYLTASGGPFNKLNLSQFNKITLNQALKHPNWKMGKKITIDSSTLMNKVFEIIEAKNIFNIPYKKLTILIHPNSYVHSIIKFKNGIIKLIAHETNMKIPIFNSLYPQEEKKLNFYTKNIDLNLLNNLNFNYVDKKKFPSVKILDFLPIKNSLFETVLVSANDSLVNLFLKKRIKFLDINKHLSEFINQNEFVKYKKMSPKSIEQILKLNDYVSLKVKTKCV